MAKLQAVLASLDDVPEALRELYFEKDGKFYLDAAIYDTDHPDVVRMKTAKANESKQRSEAVRAREELQAKLAELEARLSESTQQVDAGGGESKVIERLRKEYDEKLKSFESKLQASEQKALEAQRRLSETKLSDMLRAEAMAAGVPEGAVEDLISLEKFRKPWRLSEDGETWLPFDGDQPLAFADGKPARGYVASYLKENKHWLPPSSGGGAQGSRGPGGSQRNPYTLTREQAKDPALYRATKEAANKAGQEVTIEAA